MVHPIPTACPAPARLAPLLVLLLTTLAAQAGGQSAPRRGTAAEMASARAAFAEGIARVSRNPAAFEQVASPGPGCDVSITSRRQERGDSLVERQRFDAGALSSRMRMSIAPSGGVIVFTYLSAEGGEAVTRETARGPQGTASPERVREVVLLVAETSNQPDVQALMAAWRSLVRVCGGDVAS